MQIRAVVLDMNHIKGTFITTLSLISSQCFGGDTDSHKVEKPQKLFFAKARVV